MTRTRTVIVIGAGMAGLSAALELHRAGYQVTVLESAERVGGRVWTQRNFHNNQYAEAGGEFIEDFQYHMLGLCNEFNLTLDEVRASWTGSDKHFAIFDGCAGFDTQDSIWGCDLQAEVEQIWQAVAELAHQVQDPTRPNEAPNARALDAQSVAGWLAALPYHSVAKLAFTARMRAEYTVEMQDFSLLDLARNSKLYYSDPNENHKSFRIRGGNDQLPRAMAKVLPDVRFKAPVSSIDVQSHKVVSITADNQRFESEFCVLTVPLTAARLIDFPTPLPPGHYAMIHELHYGFITKVLIQYRKRFWVDHDWNGRLMNDKPLGYSWEATGEQGGDSGILTVYTGGAAAEALTKMEDDERMRFVIDEVNKYFPESKGLVMQAETKAWNNDPNIRGSYLAFHPGDITKHWDAIYSPASRLYFAGEYATPYQGFMEGAVESGQRVAKQIIGMG